MTRFLLFSDDSSIDMVANLCNGPPRPNGAVRTRCASIVAVLVAALSFVAAGAPVGSREQLRHFAAALLVWDDQAIGEKALDQQGFATVLEDCGFTVAQISPDAVTTQCLEAHSLVVVPNASAQSLTRTAVDVVQARLHAGLTVITDGESPLTRAMQIQFGKPVLVTKLRDHTRPQIAPLWPSGSKVSWFSGISRETDVVLCSDRHRGYPLVIVRRFSKGQALCFAPLFDPISGTGYGRFVNLPHMLLSVLGCKPPFRRQAAEAYFDPGFRMHTPTDTLVAQWQRWGIRAVHIAAWHMYDVPAYDYAPMIEAAHRNGILVYAWLEWPYVGIEFWDDHPEWRQKNALLKDAHLDFLRLMDLQNPLCMRAAMEDLYRLLELDWDGINIGEFSITGCGMEALRGPSRPDYFTGFGSTARGEFKQLHGFDPISLFDRNSKHYWRLDSISLRAFYRYRIDVNNRLLHRVVACLDRLKQARQRQWELMLTVVDDSRHPEFRNLFAYDRDHTLALVRQYRMTLQVEDPYSEWAKPPERYVAISAMYRPLLRDLPFLIDINVVPVQERIGAGYTTIKAAGSELLHLLKTASTQSPRVCLYAEVTVDREDWEVLPYAMASGATVVVGSQELIVQTPSTAVLGPFGDETEFVLDGRPWPCLNKDGVIIPQGEHRVVLRDRKEDGEPSTRRMRLISITGDLLDCRQDGPCLQIEYASHSRCILTLNRPPDSVLLDGQTSDFVALRNGEACVIVAPPGRHRVVFSGAGKNGE